MDKNPKPNLYIVQQCGIYRHEILGVYDTLSAAKERASGFIAKEEHDGYHTVSISAVPLNEPTVDATYLGEYRKQHISRYEGRGGYDRPYTHRPITYHSYGAFTNDE